MTRKKNMKTIANVKGTIPMVLPLVFFTIGNFNEFLKVKYAKGGNYEE